MKEFSLIFSPANIEVSLGSQKKEPEELGDLGLQWDVFKEFEVGNYKEFLKYNSFKNDTIHKAVPLVNDYLKNATQA